MHFFRTVSLTLILFCAAAFAVTAQDTSAWISLSANNLESFRDPGKNWTVAGEVSADPYKQHDIRPGKGTGILVNTFARNQQMHLYTKEEFADAEVELEFMMTKNSNSGIYLQGRYELQLLDSWMRTGPTSSDAGAVYMRWTQDRGTFEGSAPYMNVARAPGLWQNLRIVFRAPRFNDKQEKSHNARFEEVYLNGVLVQQHTEVTGPTGSAMFSNEQPLGPLVIQGDHGPVAFKNIRIRKLNFQDTAAIKKREWWQSVNPIVVNPDSRPAFIKTFLNHGDKKLTHVLSAGHPRQIHYSYDLKQGAVFQVWRGEFMDVTKSWYGRGDQQLGTPMGSVISLSDAPVVAVLTDANAPWPDSLAFEEMNNQGYVLNKERTPTFIYSAKNIQVKDSIRVMDNGEGISRTLSIAGQNGQVYSRLAAAAKIEKLSDGWYAVDDKRYYIQVDKKYQPSIRNGKLQELIVPVDKSGMVTYSIIW